MSQAPRFRDGWQSLLDWTQRRLIAKDKDADGSNNKPPQISPLGLILLILLGAALMMWGPKPTLPVDSDSLATSTALPITPAEESDPISRLERDLTTTLNQMLGVGTVKVLIVPAASEEHIFAEEVTTRSSTAVGALQGGDTQSESHEESVTRSPVLLRVDGGRSEEPLIRQTVRPPIAGVLIVADGADDPGVSLRMLQAVSVALGIAPHKIEIVPRKR